MDCPVEMNFNGLPHNVNNLDMWVDKFILTHKTRTLSYSANFEKCNEAGITNIISPIYGMLKIILLSIFLCITFVYKTLQRNIFLGNLTVKEANATSYAITPDGEFNRYDDSVDKPLNGNPLIRGLIYVPSSEPPVFLKLVKDNMVALNLQINSTIGNNKLTQVKTNEYNIMLNNTIVKRNVPFKLGGVYTIIGSSIGDKRSVNVAVVTEPNSMHMFWMIPQYVILTMGEVMFSVTGLEFAFTQAPTSMKSLLQACWLLTVAFGNLIVVIVAEVSLFQRQVSDKNIIFKYLTLSLSL